MKEKQLVIFIHQNELFSDVFLKMKKKLLSAMKNKNCTLVLMCLAYREYELPGCIVESREFSDIILFRIEDNNVSCRTIADTITKDVFLQRPEVLLCSTNILVKQCAAYIAQKLQTGLAADCSDFEYINDTFCFKRVVGEWPPNIATIVIKSRPQMATFVDVADDGEAGVTIVHNGVTNINEFLINGNSSAIKNSSNFALMPKDDITHHFDTYFIAGGGIDSYERVCFLKQVAEKFRVGFGVTRQIVNRGWFDEQYLVGISGRRIAPNLCITFGVSGAYQHILAIKDSKHLYAVNNTEAPIFDIAELRIKIDVNSIIDKMNEELL